MQVGTSPVRETRARHRHELRTLTYVTLDQANGGILRNLTHEGVAAQLVAAVRPRQQVRLRFELRYPRLRVETRGEVVWATFSGQCGIRFLDLSPRTARQIDEWILGNLLEGIPLHPGRDQSVFGGSVLAESVLGEPLSATPVPRAVEPSPGEDDGLTVSPAPLKLIELPARQEAQEKARAPAFAPDALPQESVDLDWLSQPLSARGVAWTVNLLAVLASLLLFALVFLGVTRELPKWPVATGAGAAVCVTALYWGFFKLFGGTSPGTRLARLAGYDILEEKEPEATRFR